MKWLFAFLLVKAALSGNPEENENSHIHGLFEGDMIISPEQKYHAEHGEDVDSDRKRGSIRNRLWQNAELVYEFAAGIDQRAVNAIRAAMAEWTSKTCIRFKQRTSEAGYVSFQSSEAGCYSFVGRTGRKQAINLGRGCWTKGIAVHEIAHALGFYHEQSRPDRDSYVTIVWANIRNGTENNFRKYERSTIDSLGTPYDYQSVMHYRGTAFSKNGQPTIIAKQSGVTLGQRIGLSTIDAQQANLLYKCPGSTNRPTPATTTRPTTGSGCKDNRGYCPRYARFCSRSSFLRANCKKTCNLCGGAPCVNRASSLICRLLSSSCSQQYIRDMCKKTCKQC